MIIEKLKPYIRKNLEAGYTSAKEEEKQDVNVAEEVNIPQRMVTSMI